MGIEVKGIGTKNDLFTRFKFMIEGSEIIEQKIHMRPYQNVSVRKEKRKERLTIRKSMRLKKIESAWSDEMDVDLKVYGWKSTMQTEG